MSSQARNRYVHLPDFETRSGYALPLNISFQIFGPALGEAPVVLVNHALTGNSDIAGPNGWWLEMVGSGKPIDTDKFTVLAFDIPGNGYAPESSLIVNYEEFNTGDIAAAFLQALNQLEVKKLFAIIGGSIGGCIAWEMVAKAPELCEHLVPIACDWKASDWLIANVRVQKQILHSSDQPLQDARMHAMTFYRSPESFRQKFNRSVNVEQQLFNIETWLIRHGDKLDARFKLDAYRHLNHLLGTTDITRDGRSFSELVRPITACIHLVNINSDGFYVPAETRETYELLKAAGKGVYYYEIDSIHGHDAFLIEYAQLGAFIEDIFLPEISGGLVAA